MKKILIVIIIAVSSCTNRNQKPEPVDLFDRNQFFVVNYEEIIKQPAVIKLSELTDSIEYVILETNDSCLLHNYAEYFFTDKYIFINNIYQILMFDRTGRFLRRIGKQGRGPGEIGLIRCLSVLDSEEALVVQTNWSRKLYYFSYQGDLIKSVSVPDVYDIKVMHDGMEIYFDLCAWGFENYMFALRNSDGDTSSVVLNHFKWENKSGHTMTVGYHLFKPFYEYGGTFSMKSMYNDTVYNIRGDKIVAEYLLDLGGFELPEELRPEVSGAGVDYLRDGSNDKRFAVSFEAGEKLFISSEAYYDIEGTGRWNMVYHRRSGKGNLVVDNEGTPGMIVNDIDGGMDFWPVGSVNDTTLYMPLLPGNFAGEENLNRILVKAASDIEKKGQFLKMAGAVRESDNPILMIVRLK